MILLNQWTIKDEDDLNGSSFLSILQRSYISIQPIIQEVYKKLVREEGEAPTLDSKAEKYIQDDNPSQKPFKSTYLGKRTQQESQKVDMRNLLGFMNQNLYHDYMNITNIMKLKRLDFRDIYGVRATDLLLTRENLVERMILLVASYF